MATIRADPHFDAKAVAEVLRTAMKGLGTDTKAIINALTKISAEQRSQVKVAFEGKYGKDLIADLKSELSGNLENTVLAMMHTGPEFDAWSLRHAMKGAGTDEGCLVEILATRSHDEIEVIKATYEKMFKRDLKKDVQSETSGHFKRILTSLVSGYHSTTAPADHACAVADAQKLLNAGERKFGTDESAFNEIFMESSPGHLRAVIEEYRKASSYDLARAVEKEMSGNLEMAYLALIESARSVPDYFAMRLYRAMKGIGTDDGTLIRVLVSRSEKDLQLIKDAYMNLYHKHLAAAVKSETSGDYERLLLAILGEH